MELLQKLYSIYSGSLNELPMREFIKEWVSENASGASVVEDKIGNIMVTKGDSESYPCVLAHTDQVQKPYPKDYEVMFDGQVFRGWSASQKRECGLGADDKNGIWVALNILRTYPIVKVAFFVGEEIGGVGSHVVDMEWFGDCRWVAQVDRRGVADFIHIISGTELCSSEFIKDLNLKEHNRKLEHGAFTDSYVLKKRGLKVSACNMSCGYYDPHTEREFTIWEDLLATYSLVCYMVEHLTKVYKHEQKPIGWNFQRSSDTLCKVNFGRSHLTSVQSQQEEQVEIICYDVIEQMYEENAQNGIDVEELAKSLYDKNGKQFGYVPLNFYKEIIEQVLEEFAESEAYFGMCEE